MKEKKKTTNAYNLFLDEFSLLGVLMFSVVKETMELRFIQKKSNRNFIKHFFVVAFRWRCDSYLEDSVFFFSSFICVFANVSIHKIFHSCSVHVRSIVWRCCCCYCGAEMKSNTSIITLSLRGIVAGAHNNTYHTSKLHVKRISTHISNIIITN